MARERDDERADYSPAILRRVPDTLGGLRLDQALARMFPEHSRSRLQHWLREGLVRLDARAAKPKQKIHGGEEVEIRPRPRPETLAFRAEPIALDVVYEDDTVIVLNKPAGMVVHPASGNWRGTLLNALLEHAPGSAAIPRAGIVHRLDKDTTGLLVAAKTVEAQTSLVRQLQARTVKREYVALVHGSVRADGEVSAAMGRHPRDRKRMATVASGKPALTRYRVLKRFEQATLLECSLATGRTHQIRVHMQSIGHPLVGETVYRGRRTSRSDSQLDDPNAARLDAFPRQALHAARLAFEHPSSGRLVRFEAPLPADLRALLGELR
jgi:23S rRNA pseudouridine1911/1915/1917 synthase